ncbi:Glycerophosphocholine phosphodiesterase [Neofusicoccum ribis]|uniref:Glycerophosphocholine phosphodiesterase n=1 Tax=Neofusicoccum ribis TaxID=45134 RepID=A0ABR3T647_9PEZI
MKFGHNLPRNQVPEWASHYINYKGLKRLVKSAAETSKNEGEADLAEFFYSLDRNLEDVDGFYNKKYAESARRLKLLYDRFGQASMFSDGIDRDELEDLVGALLELRGQLRKLQWYGEVNRRGFVKITKKLDKKVPNSCTQQRYLASKVDPKPFATNYKLQQDMKAINDWLSGLGDAKVYDDASSVHSTASLKRVSSRAILNLPSGLLDTVDQAIRNDDASILEELLHEANTGEDTTNPAYQKLLLNLLQRSISCRSRQCIQKLLSQISSLEDEDDLNKRNCVHRLVIAVGRAKTNEVQNGGQPQSSGPFLGIPNDAANFISPAESPVHLPPPSSITEQQSSKLLDANDESVQMLSFLLDSLKPEQRSALSARDSYGRLPLHYAAQYGFVIICKIVIEHMKKWGQFDVTHGTDSPEWQDSDGYAPLHLSVIGGHPLTTRTLLDSENWQGSQDEKISTRKLVSKSGAALALATKSNFVQIVKLLVEAGVDINYQDEQGETALHVAARYGHTDCAKTLIEGSQDQKANVNLAEKTFAWTPLFIACVDGHLPVAKLLVDAGADLEKPDLSGWTPKEHAALRGHLDIAKILADITPLPASTVKEQEQQLPVRSSSPPQSSIEERRSTSAKDVRLPEPVKTFGHRYLQKESMVLVSLGSMDMRKHVEPVKLDDIHIADAHATQLDTALSVVVSAQGATGEPTVIDLPVQENISTDPITFMTMDVTKVKLLFDIVPTYAGSKERVVGRGVAMLSSVKQMVGSQRMNLKGDVSVPIVAANTLEVIGSVNFNFLVITPFSHPNLSITENQTYWRSMASTMVIGHRGLGKNLASRKSLQLGENTIQERLMLSLQFDVQLTKDHVPVIYHDFLVSETGIDAPVHTLTLEQFLHVSEQKTPRTSRPSSPVEAKAENKDVAAAKAKRPRSYSVDVKKETQSEMNERMKHTRDFKMKGYKGNSRGNFIQAPFTTLEEMFRQLPESIGFNIEMKYPMLHESEEHDMDTYAVELNSFVDTVLKKVYDLGTKRNIIFSSFHPDICLLLSFKQPSIPILFLSDAGTSPVGDIRASSLQEAIRFASRWNLLGVVSAAEPLVMCPRLVRVVKESGLVCVSYGVLNNDPVYVQRQVKEGIDAVIVDSVLAIRKGLTAHEEEKKASSLTNPAGAAAAAQLANGTTNGAAVVANGANSSANGINGTDGTNDITIPPEIARIVDTVNGVPVYATNGKGDPVNGAVF